jgi:hypothetical protein
MRLDGIVLKEMSRLSPSGSMCNRIKEKSPVWPKHDRDSDRENS